MVVVVECILVMSGGFLSLFTRVPIQDAGERLLPQRLPFHPLALNQECLLSHLERLATSPCHLVHRLTRLFIHPRRDIKLARDQLG